MVTGRLGAKLGQPGGNAVTSRAGNPLVTERLGAKLGAKLGATWGQHRNFEGGKAYGHWEAGGKAGGKARNFEGGEGFGNSLSGG